MESLGQGEERPDRVHEEGHVDGVVLDADEARVVYARRKGVHHVVADDAVDGCPVVDPVGAVQQPEVASGQLARSRLVVRAEGQHRAHPLVEYSGWNSVRPHAYYDLVGAFELVLCIEKRHQVGNRTRSHGDLGDIAASLQLLDAAEDVVRHLLEVVQGADYPDPAPLGLLVQLPPLEVLLDVDVAEVSVHCRQKLCPARLLRKVAHSAVLTPPVGHDAWKVDHGRKQMRLGAFLLPEEVQTQFGHIYVLPLASHLLHRGFDRALG